MSNIVSSAIFCIRNVDKAENHGKIGRWSVAAGQAKKVSDCIFKLENKYIKQSAKVIKTFSEGSKIAEYTTKALDFAGKNINPLLCVSAGIDIINSDDKEAAFVTNAAALSSMFTVEKIMNKYLNEIPKMKCLKGITDKVLKFSKGNKVKGKIPAIIHGVAFVVGSCTAYSIGEKFGKSLVSERVEKKQ